MPPSSEQKQEQTRGAATPMEVEFGAISQQQAMSSLDSMRRAQQDPRLRSVLVDDLMAQKQAEIKQAQADIAEATYQKNTDGGFWWGGMDAVNERLRGAQTRLSSLQQSLTELEGEKQILPERLKEAQQTQELSTLASGRLRDFLAGKDLGISPEERALITQGISGISQDVATSRGLNRTDVPVMQAIAPAVSQALLSQANANRSLFTGINQFQQGMGLSQQQLQAGLAGQNPAANLTGVYSGLRSTSMGGASSSNLGFGEVMSGVGGLASGIGGFMYGMNAGTPPVKK